MRSLKNNYVDVIHSILNRRGIVGGQVRRKASGRLRYVGNTV